MAPTNTGHWPEAGWRFISTPRDNGGSPPVVELQHSAAPRSIIGHLFDAANLLTLAGLLSLTLAITFALRGQFAEAAIGLILAFFFDGIDGPVASRLSGRTPDDRAFGANLDSLVDMAGAGVTLAVVLLAYGEFGGWYIPVAFALVGAVAMRLSYFNIHGLGKEATRYTGLPTDQAIIVFAAVMLLDGLISRGPFQVVLYGTSMALVALMVSSLRIPKLTGASFYAINGAAFVIAALHAVRLVA
ncbi:MAG: CDP-diacylglycerol---serine O-phosphatidyltransferase [Chloroflexi bacterium]|nr:MAG: CDP-diacylglycerol---serine O-phosphatidyltransferase [Chloroflexota bacterium]